MLNKCFPETENITKNALLVIVVHVPWILCYVVMHQMEIFIAKVAMLKILVPKVMDLDVELDFYNVGMCKF